jgi:hypothetical protein
MGKPNFLFFSSHQIWLNPIVRDHQPTCFTIFYNKKKAGTSNFFTLKLIIVIHLKVISEFFYKRQASCDKTTSFIHYANIE